MKIQMFWKTASNDPWNSLDVSDWAHEEGLVIEWLSYWIRANPIRFWRLVNNKPFDKPYDLKIIVKDNK